jgi:hypothetical protein
VSSRTSIRNRAVVVIACALALLGMKGEPFRYSRSVTCKPGFCVVELPDDVLARARPGLPDVRVISESGELAFELEERLVAPPRTAAFVDVGNVPGQETTGLLDRGESPDPIDALSVTLEGDAPFLKPIIVEDSSDRVSFRRVAEVSIFRVPGAAMTEVRFAPNDRRYLRVRLDDRASEPRRPLSAVLHPVALVKPKERVIPVLFEADASDDSVSRFTLRVPHENLPATALVFDIAEPVFARQVRVFEKLVFRDRLTQRLVGEGRISRSAGSGAVLEVPLSELVGTSLEVEIERAGAPISLSRGELRVRPKRLVFRAPERGPLTLLYGSPDAPAPSYDLGSALAGGLPKELFPGSLAEAQDRGERSALPEAPRGPSIDTRSFRTKRPITLPSSGRLAYLDLEGVAPAAAGFVRIVDAAGRQVPFVLESEQRRVRAALQFSISSADRKTTARVTGFRASEPLHALELSASAPTYFRRPLEVYEVLNDERGPTTRRTLGSGVWEKRPEAAAADFRIEIAAATGVEMFVEFDDGDNAPVSLSGVTGVLSRSRVDFLFNPGDALFLLSDPETGTFAKYDLSLLEDALLRAPALAAKVPPLPRVQSGPEAERPRRPWFWLVVAGAFLLVVLALLRALKGASAS